MIFWRIRKEVKVEGARARGRQRRTSALFAELLLLLELLGRRLGLLLFRLCFFLLELLRVGRVEGGDDRLALGAETGRRHCTLGLIFPTN